MRYHKAEKLTIGNKTHRIACWDNGGETCDRYTVAYLDHDESPGACAGVGMSAKPFHPQGFGQHCAVMPGRHLGRRIPFANLPDDCKNLILRDLGH